MNGKGIFILATMRYKPFLVFGRSGLIQPKLVLVPLQMLLVELAFWVML